MSGVSFSSDITHVLGQCFHNVNASGKCKKLVYVPSLQSFQSETKELPIDEIQIPNDNWIICQDHNDAHHFLLKPLFPIPYTDYRQQLQDCFKDIHWSSLWELDFGARTATLIRRWGESGVEEIIDDEGGVQVGK